MSLMRCHFFIVYLRGGSLARQVKMYHVVTSLCLLCLKDPCSSVDSVRFLLNTLCKCE